MDAMDRKYLPRNKGGEYRTAMIDELMRELRTAPSIIV
jgi:hypothetical protein